MSGSSNKSGRRSAVKFRFGSARERLKNQQKREKSKKCLFYVGYCEQIISLRLVKTSHRSLRIPSGLQQHTDRKFSIFHFHHHLSQVTADLQCSVNQLFTTAAVTIKMLPLMQGAQMLKEKVTQVFFPKVAIVAFTRE